MCGTVHARAAWDKPGQGGTVSLTHLRSGACGLSLADLEAPPAPSDPIEAAARSRESAAVYSAWINAGKTREVIEAERIEAERSEARRRRGGDDPQTGTR
jgi:hypothetical protein